MLQKNLTFEVDVLLTILATAEEEASVWLGGAKAVSKMRIEWSFRLLSVKKKILLIWQIILFFQIVFTIGSR